MNNFVLDINGLLTKDHHIKRIYDTRGVYGPFIVKNRKRGDNSPSSIKHY
jgi:hypothetical protein